MGAQSDEAEKLVKEGVELSSDIMDGIYNSKKKKMIIILLALLVVLAVIVAALWITGYPTYAVTVGIGGIIIIIVLLIYNIRNLQGLKRELDALYHYISY